MASFNVAAPKGSLSAIHSSQSFHVDYAALGLQPKRTPLRVAKRKDMHRDCNDCNTGKARAATPPAAPDLTDPVPPSTSRALTVHGKKRKRRRDSQILMDMWKGLSMWGKISEEKREALALDQFGRTVVDGTRRSQRIASSSAKRNLLKET